jgi:starch synthase (maltosyl-transferring)
MKKPKPKSEPLLIYNLYPRLAGHMPQWKNHIGRILDMRFNWIYLNPTYYPGFSGSIYSVKDYYGVDPIIIDGNAPDAPMDQLRRVISAFRESGLRVMLDMVINHTAIDSVLVHEHPDWYRKKPDGSIKHPGVFEKGKLVKVWGDLAEIDNEESPDRENLWNYWLNVARFYLQMGVTGFRCDAAYQIPVELWEYMISALKSTDRSVIFCAETLGCPFEDVIALGNAGFDYTFNSSKWWDFKADWCMPQYEESRHIAPTISFAETHDTERLMTEYGGNVDAVKMRYAFSAMFSTGVMMPIGFEHGFRKRINVVNTNPLDWEPPTHDLTGYIQKVNALKLSHKVLHQDNSMEEVTLSNPAVLGLLKTAFDEKSQALILINTDRQDKQSVQLPSREALFGTKERVDDVSPEGACAVPESLVFTLEPSQIKILLAQ